MERVISGGQTGVDQLGLIAAKAAGIPTGGTAPKGYLTEIGPDLRLKSEWGLVENAFSSYTVRTKANVQNSNGNSPAVTSNEINQ